MAFGGPRLQPTGAPARLAGRAQRLLNGRVHALPLGLAVQVAVCTGMKKGELAVENQEKLPRRVSAGSRPRSPGSRLRGSEQQKGSGRLFESGWQAPGQSVGRQQLNYAVPSSSGGSISSSISGGGGDGGSNGIASLSNACACIVMGHRNAHRSSTYRIACHEHPPPFFLE